ncbi:MAG: hypothetical protein ACPHNY_03780 [Akkermansiaceae bacterium]
MKSLPAACIIRLSIVLSCLCLLPSCKLVRSVAKIPASIIKTTGRTLGVSNLTDHSPRSIEAAASARENGTPQEPEEAAHAAHQDDSTPGQ